MAATPPAGLGTTRRARRVKSSVGVNMHLRGMRECILLGIPSRTAILSGSGAARALGSGSDVD